jgi:hypothetical protein
MNERIHIGCSCWWCRHPWEQNKIRQEKIKLNHRRKRRMYKENLKKWVEDIVELSIGYTD